MSQLLTIALVAICVAAALAQKDALNPLQIYTSANYQASARVSALAASQIDFFFFSRNNAQLSGCPNLAISVSPNSGDPDIWVSNRPFSATGVCSSATGTYCSSSSGYNVDSVTLASTQTTSTGYFYVAVKAFGSSNAVYTLSLTWRGSSGACSTTCTSAQYKSTAGTCTSCPPGAASCASATVAIACSAGYVLSQTTGTCFASSSCAVGSYPASGVCASCPADCTSCLSSQACLGCQAGLALAAGTCGFSCGSNCAFCSSSSTCQSCQSGYYVSSGNCYSNAAYVSSYSYDDSSSSAGPLFFVLPIVSGVIFGIVFLVRRWQLQQQSALVTSIEPEATRIVGYPGAVPMVPAPIAGVAMHERNVVTTKTYSAGANAPVPIGYAHTGNQSQHQQQYQPYGGAFGVPVQQQQPMHGTPTQYMHHPGQQQQQPLPYSNSQLPSAIPAFFSPGDTNAQQPPQPQPNQSYSDSLPGQVASSNSAVNGTSFAPAPPASYAFATPAGSFAPSAPPLPPAYSAESHDPAYISNAQIGQEYVSQPPPPSYL